MQRSNSRPRSNPGPKADGPSLALRCFQAARPTLLLNSGTCMATINWIRILESLREFDHVAKPFGLYAANEFRRPEGPEAPLIVEWELALKPAFKACGCNAQRTSRLDLKNGRFRFQNGGPLDVLDVVRLSKIKVRKYGNAFRVDPHLDFSNRWRKTALDSHLGKVATDGWNRRRALLFIGFSAEPSPFKSELKGLPTRFCPTAQLVWDDPHGRGFKTRAVVWSFD